MRLNCLFFSSNLNFKGTLILSRSGSGSSQTLFSEVSCCTWSLEERKLSILPPASFLQEGEFILRQMLFVVHPNLLNEGFFGEELSIFEIFPEVLTKITL